MKKKGGREKKGNKGEFEGRRERGGEKREGYTFFDKLDRLERSWYANDIFYFLFFHQLGKTLCGIYDC